MSSSDSLVPSLEYNGLGRTTLITTWVLTGVSFICLALQILSSHISHLPLRLDDVFYYLAFVVALTLVSLTTWAVVDKGQGSHMSAETWSEFELVAKSLLINEILWGVVNTFLRLAAILFARRVFAFPLIRHSFTTLLSLSTAYGFAVVIAPVVICRPIRAGWDPTVSGNCGSEKASYLALELLGLMLDLAITTVPIFPISRLQVSIRRKINIGLIFAIGVLVVVVTSFRLAALRRVNSRDFTYDYGYLGLLTVTGALVGIILCSVPSLFRLGAFVRESGGLKSALRTIWRSSQSPDISLRSSNNSTPTLAENEDNAERGSLKGVWVEDEERGPTPEGNEVIYMETYRKSLRPFLVISPESQTHERVVSPAASSHESVTDATHPGISIESGKSVSKSIAEGNAKNVEAFEGLPTAITPLRTEDEAEINTAANIGDKAGDKAAVGGSNSDIMIPEKAVTAREFV